MTSRREFLQIGITATAWPFAASALAEVASTRIVEPLPLYRVVVDRRFPEGLAFAERAEALGLQVRSIDGDMTRFWYDELYYRWREGPVAIAGFTAHGPMFCFEQLARDRRMRVVFRAEHAFQSAGVEHSLTGPLSMLQRSLALDDSATWPTCMADVLARCPNGRAEISRTTAISPTRVRPVALDSGSLYSWIIAPAARA